MRIHHTLTKKAADAGFAIQVITPEGADVAAGVAVTNDDVTVFHTDPKIGFEWAKLAAQLRAEFPVLTVVSVDVGTEAQAAFTPDIWFTADGGQWLDFPASPAPTLADVQAVCEEKGLDMEAEIPEDDAEGTGGNVVPSKYRELYKSRGNANHCGDWLASFLDGKFQTSDGAFMHEPFETLLRDNGVPIEGKWTTLPVSGQRGWQGRYRMNGRQLLDKYVAEQGFLMDAGDRVELPEDFLATIREKHAKWLDKRQKARDKAANDAAPAEAEIAEAA